MEAAYLYLNAVLYAVFCLGCTLAPRATATKLGYATLTSGGRSEYLVIYGGLQLGLSAVFWALAHDPLLHRPGIFFALLLYCPIVAYRLISLALLWPVRFLTVATGCLESVLLLVAVLLVVFP